MRQLSARVLSPPKESSQSFGTLFPRMYSRRIIIGVIRITSARTGIELTRARCELSMLTRVCDAVLVENHVWGRHGAELEPKVADQLTIITRELLADAQIPVGLSLSPCVFAPSFAIARKCGLKLLRLAYVTGSFSNGPRVSHVDLANLREAHPEITVLGGVNPRDYRATEEISFSMAGPRAKAFSDAVIVTHNESEYETQSSLRTIRQNIGSHHPLLIEGNMPAETAVELLRTANGIIVDQYFRGTSSQLDDKRMLRMANRIWESAW